jgi:hypothetical protein
MSSKEGVAATRATTAKLATTASVSSSVLASAFDCYTHNNNSRKSKKRKHSTIKQIPIFFIFIFFNNREFIVNIEK